jgi:hypothetical protein
MEQFKNSQGINHDNRPNFGSSSPLNNYEEFNKFSPSRFYTEKEEVTLRFYQVPKALFKNPAYKGLGLGPKLMYSILRDSLDLSIKNNWKDKNGYIYLVFSIEELSALLEINKETVTTYKRELVKYRLIIDRRLGQGKSNMIYILKPEIKEIMNTDFPSSRERKSSLLENGKSDSINTYVNKTDRENNVKGNAILKITKKEKRSPEKEYLAEEMAEQLNDDHSLGFYRKIADTVPENLIFQALSEVKDAFLTGRVKKSKAALFTTVIQSKAQEYNINLDIKKTEI